MALCLLISSNVYSPIFYTDDIIIYFKWSIEFKYLLFFIKQHIFIDDNRIK